MTARKQAKAARKHEKRDSALRWPMRVFGPRVCADILEALREGNYVHIACEAAGIPRKTFYEWMARGRKGEQPFASFHRDVQAAIRGHERDAVATLLRHGKLQWQALAWTLERRHPQRWGRRLPVAGAAAGFALPEGTSTEDAIAVTKAYLSSLESTQRKA